MNTEDIAMWVGLAVTALGGAMGLGQNKQKIEGLETTVVDLKNKIEVVPERLARLETHIENIKETNQAILEELRK